MTIGGLPPHPTEEAGSVASLDDPWQGTIEVTAAPAVHRTREKDRAWQIVGRWTKEAEVTGVSAGDGPGDSHALWDAAPALPLQRDARNGLVAEMVAHVALRVPSYRDSLDPEDRPSTATIAATPSAMPSADRAARSLRVRSPTTATRARSAALTGGSRRGRRGRPAR